MPTTSRRRSVFGRESSTGFQFTQEILRMIFYGWIGGIIDFSNSILAHCANEKLRTAYRIGLGKILGQHI
jgi:hypothetical protein